MPLSDIVQVSVKISAAQVAAAAFDVPMILGSSTRISPDRFRIYTDLAGMEADGFLTSDAEHAQAAVLLEQDNRPASFVVGRRLTPVAQTATITINTDTNTDVYTANVNGTACSYTSLGTGVNATATGLAAAIQAQVATTGVGAVAVGAVITLTAQIAGNAFTCTLAGTGALLMTLVNPVVANHGVAEDLTDIRVAGADWYATLETSRSKDDALNGAAWTEANNVPPTMFFPQSSESSSATTVVDANGTDLANKLKKFAYKRTGLWWHSLDAEYLDAGITGREIPTDPGTENWALKGVVAVSPDTISSTNKANLLAKYANIYYPLKPGGQNPITYKGTTASGIFIDVVRFVDFLTARIQEAVANLFLTQEKVEFDETGLQQIASQVAGELQKAKDAHKVVDFTVSVPAISSISSSDRAARRLNPSITFQAQLSGAFDFAQISGIVVE